MMIAELLHCVKKHLKENFRPGVHHVACALMIDDKVFYGLHLDVSGGFDVCAEPIAISNAISSTGDIVLKSGTIVVVAWDGQSSTEPWVITPCGNCRQILNEYTIDLNILINDDEFITLPLSKLLPYPYKKTN